MPCWLGLNRGLPTARAIGLRTVKTLIDHPHAAIRLVAVVGRHDWSGPCSNRPGCQFIPTPLIALEIKGRNGLKTDGTCVDATTGQQAEASQQEHLYQNDAQISGPFEGDQANGPNLSSWGHRSSSTLNGA